MLLRKDRQQLLLKLIREARLSSGLRQADVAAVMGKPQSYVAKIERGERNIDFIEVLDISRVVGLDPVKLVERLS